MAGEGEGSNTTHALLSPDPDTLPIGGCPAQPQASSCKPFVSKANRQLLLMLPNGRSQLFSEPEILPRHYPLGVGS